MPLILPPRRCIICRGYAIDQQLKIGTGPSVASRRWKQWKHLSMESFSMLFGLGVNHHLVAAMFFEGSSGSEDGKLCNKCFQDVSDVHYIFWQLYSLESKLIQLQTLIFQRLHDNYNTAMVTNKESVLDAASEMEIGTQDGVQKRSSSDELIKVLFEEILLNRNIWPKGTYTSRWKQAQECLEKIVYQQMENPSEIQHNSDEIITEAVTVKGEPLDLETEHFDTDPAQPVEEQMSCQEESEDGDDDNISFDDDNYDHDSDSDWNSEEEVKLQRTRKSTKSKQKKAPAKSPTKEPQDGVLRRFLCTMDPDICSRTFERKKKLTRHINEFHKGRNHVCDFEGCVQKFLCAKSLEWHKTRCHGIAREKKFVCTVDPDICKREYSEKSDLKEHIKIFHEGRIHPCDHDNCKEKFKSTLKLLSHQIKVHGYEKKKRPGRVCHICGETVNPKSWKKHFIHKHDGNMDNPCSRCSMNFETPQELENHNQLHDQVVATLPFTCIIEDCRTVFSNSLELKNHVMIIHQTNWPQCEICGTRKPNQDRLQLHMKAHRKEKNVICDQCPKSFHSEARLKRHKEDYHMGIKYTCETCGKEYALKNSFIRHTRGHAEEKAWKCKFCPKSFHSSDALKRHEATHAGVKNYPCPICGKRFKQEQNLRQHLNTQQHKGQKVEIASQVFAQGVKLENAC